MGLVLFWEGYLALSLFIHTLPVNHRVKGRKGRTGFVKFNQKKKENKENKDYSYKSR